MSTSHVVTTRLDEETLAALSRLADYHDRSRAWLVAEAVRRYVKEEVEFLAFLDEGERAIDRGDFVTHEQLVEEIEARRKGKRAA